MPGRDGPPTTSRPGTRCTDRTTRLYASQSRPAITLATGGHPRGPARCTDLYEIVSFKGRTAYGPRTDGWLLPCSYQAPASSSWRSWPLPGRRRASRSGTPRPSSGFPRQPCRAGSRADTSRPRRWPRSSWTCWVTSACSRRTTIARRGWMPSPESGRAARCRSPRTPASTRTRPSRRICTSGVRPRWGSWLPPAGVPPTMTPHGSSSCSANPGPGSRLCSPPV